jgi:hypothetical protein
MRRVELIIHWLPLILVILAIGLTFVGRPLGEMRPGVGYIVLGLCLLIAAKLSVVRKDGVLNFGSKNMEPSVKVVYWQSYAFIVGGLVVFIVK